MQNCNPDTWVNLLTLRQYIALTTSPTLVGEACESSAVDALDAEFEDNAIALRDQNSAAHMHEYVVVTSLTMVTSRIAEKCVSLLKKRDL